MGLEIDRVNFDAEERERFRERLADNLEALRSILDRPDFGLGPASIGAELELYLVDDKGRALHRNVEVQRSANDPRLTLELNRYNLEYNLTPVPAAGRPFSTIEAEMCGALRDANDCAARHAGRVVPVGILPTLRRSDLGPHAMTDQNRYHALTSAMQRLRGELFSVRINGKDPISLRARDVTLEGANTSMQVHLRVTPGDFAKTFNAVQLVTPVAVAVAANSPLLLGHRLWQETRIPLFKHSIDGRNADSRAIHLPSRVDYGNGWVRHGAFELFASTVYLHEPILPVCSDEVSTQVLAGGGLPRLYELCLHQGTCWPWNRPVYDCGGDGHLRIELRALPSGPSPTDMLANAAFAIGAAMGLRERIEDLLPAVPFSAATHNFYRGAEGGLSAKLLWPRRRDMQLVRTPVVDIAEELLPTARAGLESIGVESAEAEHYIGVIARRLEKRRTGASWQLRTTEQLQRKYSQHKALRIMLQRYMDYTKDNVPVSEWAVRG